jgi:hypothetical protein
MFRDLVEQFLRLLGIQHPAYLKFGDIVNQLEIAQLMDTEDMIQAGATSMNSAFHSL